MFKKIAPLHLETIHFYLMDTSESSFSLRQENKRLLEEINRLTQKLAEQEWLEKRMIRQYQGLVSNMQTAILLENEHREVVLVNQSFCDLFQINQEPHQMVGQDCRNMAFLAKDFFRDPDQFILALEQCMLDRKTVMRDLFYTVDHRIIERDYIPIFSDENEYQGHLWQYRDVTEQRNVQEIIRKSEEKYRGIIENMSLGILEVDLNDVIVRAYHRFCELTGYTEKELIGQNASEILLGDEVFKRLVADQNKIRETGTPGAYEVPIRKKNGEPLWVIVSGAPVFDEDGQVIGSMGIHLDITERKKMEEVLQEARQTAEEARNAEKRFLANMSHEIRTPINAIIGMTHLLLDTTMSDKQRDYLNAINYSTETLLSLVSDILDISKIDAGEMQIVDQVFQLKDLLQGVVHTFQVQAEKKNIQLEFIFDADIQYSVIGDPTFITQIVLNLLSNAMKFTEHGRVQLEVSLLCTVGDFLMTEFKVVDSGMGMSPQEVEHIFDSFKQGNQDVKSKYGGTGLGLAIVKQLVNLHGGDVSVESEKGVGSTFSFTLPLRDSGQRTLEVTEQVQEESSDWQALSILVVEDNLMNLKYLEGLFEKWKVHYEVAQTGEEALLKSINQRFDLILMDIRLPDTDGYWVTQQIRANPSNPNEKTTIIALTATATTEEVEKSVAAGMQGYLPKPYRPDQLKSVLKQHVRGTIAESSVALDMKEDMADSTDLEARLVAQFENQPAYARDMLRVFFQAIPPDLDKMKELVLQPDVDQLGKLAHKIKPSWAMVGFPELSEQLQTIERLARSGASWPEVKDHVSHFLNESSHRLSELQGILTRWS